MKSESRRNESQLISELISEVKEVGRHLKEKQILNYSFSPSVKAEKETYHHSMKLMMVIHDLLNESLINIKSRGYSYIKDAVCIIRDHGTLDVCLKADIYPHIARKHGISGTGRIEHNIRNSINAAYLLHESREGRSSTFMDRFDSRPTTKEFLLHLIDEVDRRLLSMEMAEA